MAILKSVQKGVFTLAATENVATETLSTAVDSNQIILFKGISANVFFERF